MIDMRGMEFEVGDKVAVARRQASSAWIALRQVDKVVDGVPWLKDGDKRPSRKYMGTSMAILNVSAIDS